MDTIITSTKPHKTTDPSKISEYFHVTSIMAFDS